MPYSDPEKARKWARENVRWGLYHKKYRDRNVLWVKEYLAVHPCVDCGENDPVVLEFDHVTGEKLSEVSSLAQTASSLDRIKREIAKCEVRCANCHRRKTAARRTEAKHAGVEAKVS